ncbi:MAG TPA: tetratricopeptide repeat protein, partial [Rudaea sp.]
RWFISMDFVDGESLERRLDRIGKLPTEEAVAITRGLLDGLAAAHQRGVIHRDLKPANILLDANGTAFITDFGVARSIGTTGMTQSGIVVGTPEYLSPEQARGDKLDARSDLYTVGLMLYEMLCGNLPFTGGTPAETVMQRIIRPPPSLAKARADLPAWLHAFDDRLLKLNPAHRFATAQEALRALETRRVPRPPLNRRALAAAVLALGVIGAGGAWLWTHPRIFAAAGARATTVPRVAVLPLKAPADGELAAVARAIEEDLRERLRGDATHPVVPRRRVLDAIARQTLGQDPARQIPDIAGAADAKWVVSGDLQKSADGLTLALDVWNPDAEPATKHIPIHAKDANELIAAYRTAIAGALTDAGLRPGARTEVSDAPAFGHALLDLDAGKNDAAANGLAALATQQPESAALAVVLLDAQEQAQQELPEQALVERALTQFANDATPAGRELYARALIAKDRSADALGVLEKTLQQFPSDAALNLLYAQTLDASGDGAKAIDVLQRYVAIDTQDARAWFLLGKTAIQQGRADAAVSNYLTRALVLNRLAGNRAAEAETSNALGVGYERLGQLEAAAQQYTQAVEIREKIGDDEGLAKSLRNLAIVQAVRGDRDAADKTLDRVKVLLEKRNDRAALADLFNDRGVVAEEHGDYDDALIAYRKGLALRQELNLVDLVPESLNNVAFTEYNLGDYDNALVFWQQALAQYEKVDDQNRMLQIQESIGLLDIARGRFAAAREKLETTLRNAEDHQLSEEAAVAHLYLAQLDLTEGRYADAATAIDRAAPLFERRSDQRGRAEAALLRIHLMLALGDVTTAGQQLAALPSATLTKEQRVAYLRAQAQQARRSGDLARAATQIEAAHAAAGKGHSAEGVRVELEAVRLALQRGDSADGGKRLAALRDDTARLAEIPVRLQWLELETAFALRQRRNDEAARRYREAIAILKTTGNWAGAAVLHELGARALPAGTAEATAAQAAAAQQRQQLLAQAPPDARQALGDAIARELDEIGGDHGS